MDTIRFLYRGPTPAELVILLRQKFWISLNTMNEWQRNAKCKQSPPLVYSIVIQNVPHKNSRTHCDENYNTSSSFAKEVVSLFKSTNDKRNIQFFFQHPSLKKPHHITTFWFSEVVNYHPNLLHQICTDLELALIRTALFMDLRCVHSFTYSLNVCIINCWERTMY